MFAGQSNFLQALGWAVLNSLWQMAILWIIFLMITGSFKFRPAQKSSLATGLLIGGFAWFIYTFFSILTIVSPHDSIISSGIITTSANEAVNNWLRTMLPLASLVYLVLLILPVYYFIRNYRYVQIVRNEQLSKLDVNWRIFVRNVSAHMGIKKPVHIWLSGFVTSPVTIGYLKPVILIPFAAINHLTSEQMEAVILHELAHIRRHDYFVNLIIRFIQSILYFNPFVKSLVKYIEREREKSCDDIVLQFQYDPHKYASALLTIEKTNHFPKPFAVAASGKKNDLLHRVEWLLGVRKRQALTFNKLAGVLAAVVCFIGINALLLASKPTVTENRQASFTNMHSPFFFFAGDMINKETTSPDQTITPVETTSPIINHITTTPVIIEDVAVNEKVKRSILDEVNEELTELEMEEDLKELSAFKYVNFLETIVPTLAKEEELQVKEALANSRKVIEKMKWKAVETDIADALSTTEKSYVKLQLEKQIQEIDWQKLEANVKTAYDQIDWDAINKQLSVAMSEIKLDSLQRVYNAALVELSSLQKELTAANLTAIPDTDINLRTIDDQKNRAQRVVNTIKAARNRKVVKL